MSNGKPKGKGNDSYLNSLSSSLVDETENIIEKKSSEIEDIINVPTAASDSVENLEDSKNNSAENNSQKAEDAKVNSNISNKYKSRNRSAEQSPKKEIKVKPDPLIKFTAPVKKVLQKNSELEYGDTTNTKVSNEANRYLKIMSLASDVAGYKIASSLIVDFYNKHKDEFNI